MNIHQHPQAIELLSKPKQKFTKITCTAMGAHREDIVTRGLLRTGDTQKLFYTVGKKRISAKGTPVFDFTRPTILLRGWHTDTPMIDYDQVHVSASGGTFRSTMIGSGARLWHPDGPDALVKFLAEHCVLHSMDKREKLDFLVGGEERVSMLHLLMLALPAPINLDPAVPVGPVRKAFLTEVQKQKLRDAKPGSMKPVFKIFGGGAHTYLQCRLDEDGDTLKAFCDIGYGMVEFGPVSLRELEEACFKPLNLGMERDKWFTRCDYTPDELLAMERIPTNLQKDKAASA